MKIDADSEASRYARQIILDEVGIEGQQRIKNSKVLVVGAGGLGSPVLLYLSAAGVGTIGIVDDDIVSASNLHRQILYTTADIGKLKVQAAKRHLKKLNPHIQINTYEASLIMENAQDIVSGYEIVVDATDNFPSKYLIDYLCRKHAKPMVFASISQFEGQISVFNYTHPHAKTCGPGFRDVFPSPPPPHLSQTCSEAGVLGVVPGLVGCLQANEVLKLILDIEQPLSGSLLSIDCLANNFRLLKLTKSGCIARHTPTQYEPSIPSAEKVERVSPSGLRDWMSDPQSFQFIDVRETSESVDSSLGGIVIPLRQIVNRISELDINRRIVFYCKSGKRSDAAVLAVKSALPDARLFTLEGCIDAYLKLYPEKHETAQS